MVGRLLLRDGNIVREHPPFIPIRCLDVYVTVLGSPIEDGELSSDVEVLDQGRVYIVVGTKVRRARYGRRIGECNRTPKHQKKGRPQGADRFFH